MNSQLKGNLFPRPQWKHGDGRSTLTDKGGCPHGTKIKEFAQLQPGILFTFGGFPNKLVSHFRQRRQLASVIFQARCLPAHHPLLCRNVGERNLQASRLAIFHGCIIFILVIFFDRWVSKSGSNLLTYDQKNGLRSPFRKQWSIMFLIFSSLVDRLLSLCLS